MHTCFHGLDTDGYAYRQEKISDSIIKTFFEVKSINGIIFWVKNINLCMFNDIYIIFEFLI